MDARSIMQPHVIVSYESASLREIATHLVTSRVSGFPIVDDGGAVVGIVTELDIINAIHEGFNLDHVTAADIMTRGVIWVDADTPVNEVVALLHKERFIRVPVRSGDDFVGIISRSDILRAAINLGVTNGRSDAA